MHNFEKTKALLKNFIHESSISEKLLIQLISIENFKGYLIFITKFDVDNLDKLLDDRILFYEQKVGYIKDIIHAFLFLE